MKILMILASSVVGIVAVLGVLWFTNLGGIKERLLVSVLVKMRVAPERLGNPKTPKDYGMDFVDVDIVTADNVRLSAWEIKAPTPSNKTLIVNHPLTTTRYGSLTGLDDVPAEFLPMIKHLHDANYNIVMYDHRGQGDSDGGIGKTMIGSEAPVGAGETEWQDVVASLKYVKNHPDFGDDQIAFVSQCMGANATFLAWRNEGELFKDPAIKSLVAIQPTVSYRMIDRLINIKTGMKLVDQVLEAQKEQYGFGYAESLENVKSLTVPVLYSQVRKDVYTFDAESGRNDIQDIQANTPTDSKMIWIGPDEAKPFGTSKRFDGYGYYNKYPEELLSFLDGHFS